MKKLAVLGTSLCIVLAFTSCKSGESAYKKAYEKAKQQELAQPKVAEPVEVAPVADVPLVETKKATTTTNSARQERLTVQGNGTLLEYSVVCGSFQTKANAEALQEDMARAGYKAIVAYNPDKFVTGMIDSDHRTDEEKITSFFIAYLGEDLTVTKVVRSDVFDDFCEENLYDKNYVLNVIKNYLKNK